ncbi:MAG: Sec-independent protein translocase protein TatB [Xanthobacteraceae bacterium]
MFDISWTEFLLIGVVALIVIGPKELPTVMRTLGQYTRKIRGMAADFQNQFHEALREADMADLKKQVDDMASDIKNYDPLKDVRTDLETVGKDVETSLALPADAKPAESTAEATVELKPVAPSTPALSASSAEPELPLPDAAAPAATAPTPEPVTVAAEPPSTERN